MTTQRTEKGTDGAVATERLLGKGLDVGTANLVAATQNPDGSITVKLERNAFLDVNADVYSKAMLTKLKVPYVMRGDRLIVIGQASFELANVFGRETRRPMKDGLISPNEVDGLPMIRLIIEKILGEPAQQGENCYFSVPAPSIDRDNNIIYHQGLFEGMLRSMGYNAKAINEGHAVVFSELAESDFSGIGLSFGGGMVNICVCYKTIPALSFSVGRSGDWIDRNVADALGCPRSRATFLKERGVDLCNPKGREEEAISIFYRNLIQYVLSNIKARFENTANMPQFNEAVPIVCSGGTALPKNFVSVFQDEFKKMQFPIPVSTISLANEPLNSVAKGCLVAAALGDGQ
jgi:actin-like ATPase involved in cell morphogenesis